MSNDTANDPKLKQLKPAGRQKFLSLALLVFIVLACLGIWSIIDKSGTFIPTSVISFMPDAKFQFAIGGEGSTGENSLSEPMTVAIGDNGDIYVGDTLNSLVKVFDSKGKFKFSFGGKDLTYLPVDVAVAGKSVFVVDSKHSRIQVFDLTGRYQKPFAGPEIGKKIGAWIPSAIAVSGNGDVYAADVFYQRVIVFDKNGDVKTHFGFPGSGNGQMLYPNGIAVDSSGNVYVADSNNQRIQIFDEKGKFVNTLNNDGQAFSFNMPRGITLSGDNLLYVVETFSHELRMLKLNKDGIKKTTVIGDRGVGDGQMNFPNDVAVKGSTLGVADRANNRVLVYHIGLLPF